MAQSQNRATGGFWRTFWTSYLPLIAFIFGEGVIIKGIQFMANLLGFQRFGTIVFAWILFVAGGILWGVLEYRATKVGERFYDPILWVIAWFFRRKSMFIRLLAYLVALSLVGAFTVPPLKAERFPYSRAAAIVASVIYASIWVPFLFWVPIPGIR